MKKLAIIITHPIQYYAPVFKLLNERRQIEIKVYYTWGQNSSRKHDPGFTRIIEWDLPLLEGYPFEWAINTSSNPGSHNYSGVKNPGLIRQILLFKPDAVLVFGWAYHSHLQVIRHFKSKLPIYFRGDSTLLDKPRSFLKLLLKKLFLTWVYSHIDKALYVGSANKEYFLKYGLEENQLYLAPHAVDNGRFAEDRSVQVHRLRKNLGLNNSDILILFAGKLENKKDPQILLDAFLELNKSEVHLLFTGNGKLEEQLKNKCHATRPIMNSTPINFTGKTLTKRIHFLDFQNQSQMPVIYQACDLFCLPSKGPGESWGLAINEAMACGKAILASDKVGSSYDLVKEGDNGMIFKFTDLSDLKEKLEFLTASKTRLDNYGKKSKNLIRDWNFNNIASTIESIIIHESKNNS
jgi:glycosyltransferase involved in cell wall biosynthesis